jgi:uncharacterized protein (DUF433 family)
MRAKIRYTGSVTTGCHPHIVSDPEVCGGSPHLAGTRITVRTVVIASLLHGQTPEELLQHYPHLTLAAIHDALSYYYDHRETVDREIAEHEALDPGLQAQSAR